MHTLLVLPCLMYFPGRACEGNPSPRAGVIVTPAGGSCIPPEPVTDTEQQGNKECWQKTLQEKGQSQDDAEFLP